MRINKKSAVAAFFGGALALLPALSYADATVDGGTITFTGKVITTACALSSSSTTQSIDMGEVGSLNLAEAGTTLSTGKDFTIELTDCDPEVYDQVKVTFSGEGDITDPTSLATSLNNLAIRIFDSQGTQVNLGEPSSATTLNSGNNTLKFNAKFHTPLGGVSAGDVNAVATYTLTYS
ncbi:fimbrial protein [Phytobacter sp. V91]|uniref:fimbrial protein n=1 Tax=Phytobacter sp. V91 TaxID=3369425 RepID=UPI003F64549A